MAKSQCPCIKVAWRRNISKDVCSTKDVAEKLVVQFNEDTVRQTRPQHFLSPYAECRLSVRENVKKSVTGNKENVEKGAQNQQTCTANPRIHKGNVE